MAEQLNPGYEYWAS